MGFSENENVACRDCGEPFQIGTAERSYYASLGSRLPVSCPGCRISGRAERNARLIKHYETGQETATWSETLGHYGGATQAPLQRGPRNGMFPATCAACGESTTVPFSPRSGKPVYCRDCFNTRRNQ